MWVLKGNTVLNLCTRVSNLISSLVRIGLPGFEKKVIMDIHTHISKLSTSNGPDISLTVSKKLLRSFSFTKISPRWLPRDNRWYKAPSYSIRQGLLMKSWLSRQMILVNHYSLFKLWPLFHGIPSATTFAILAMRKTLLISYRTSQEISTLSPEFHTAPGIRPRNSMSTIKSRAEPMWTRELVWKELARKRLKCNLWRMSRKV